MNDKKMVRPPYEKDQKVEKYQTFNFDKNSNFVFDAPCST